MRLFINDDEIAYFTVRWKTRASFVYRTKTWDNTDKDSKRYKVINCCESSRPTSV